MSQPGTDHQLRDQLTESSSQFARSALQALADASHATFLLHAATALEHLAKAVLADRHPSLIVSARDFDSLLHACGQSAHARQPRSRMRTIGAQESVERVAHLVPRIGNLAEDLELLIRVRNGVVHLGELSATDTSDVLVAYLKASEELRDALDIERAEYWQGFASLVDSALKEHVTQARLRAETALAAARAEFERRFRDFDDVAREATLRAIEASYVLGSKYQEQLVDCPACGTQAYVYGSLKTDWEAEWDGDPEDPHPSHVHLTVTFIPSSLGCHACHLELHDEDELYAAGIDSSWELEDVDERDFYEDSGWPDI